VSVAAVLPMLILGAPAARATYPGTNGRILFSRAHGSGFDAVYQLFSMNPDGSRVKQLTNLKDGVDIGTATADGTRIAFGSNGNVWVMNADGSHRRQISSTGTYVVPEWSPDGSQIAFALIKPRGSAAIGVMNADGSGAHVIARIPKTFSYLPDWSPDGTKIAFTNQSKHGYRIYTVDPDGKHLAEVPITFSPNTIEDAGIESWSPDGTRLAFSAQPVKNGKPICDTKKGGGCDDIYIVRAAGGAPTRVTRDREEDLGPVWSADGSLLVYDHDSTPGGCVFGDTCAEDIYTIKIDGSGARRLTTAKGDEEADWWMVG